MDSTEKMLQDALNMGLGNVARILSQCVEPRRRSSSADQEEKREQPPKEDSQENENSGKEEEREILTLVESQKSRNLLSALRMLEAIPKKDFDANENLKRALFYLLADDIEEVRSKAKSLAKQLGYPTPTDLFKSLSESNKKEIMNKILKYLQSSKKWKIREGFRMLEAIPKEDFQKNEKLRAALFYALFDENEKISSKAKSLAKQLGYPTPTDLWVTLEKEIVRDTLDLISDDPNHKLVLEKLEWIRGVSQEEFNKNDYFKEALFFFNFTSDKVCAEMAKTTALYFGYPTPTDLFRSLSDGGKQDVVEEIHDLLRSISFVAVVGGLEMLEAIPKKDFDANENLKKALFYLLFCRYEKISSKAKSLAKQLGYPTPTDLFKSLSEPNKKKIVDRILEDLHDSEYWILKGLRMLTALLKEDFQKNENLKKALFYLLFCRYEKISSKAKSVAEHFGYPTPTDLFKSLSDDAKREVVEEAITLTSSLKSEKVQRGLEMLEAIPKKDFDANENLKKTLFYLLFRVDGDIRTEAESVIAHFDYTPETLYNSLQNKQERDKLVVKIMDKLSNCLRKERDPENSVAFELLSKLRGILQRAQATDDASTVAHKDFAFGNAQGKGKAKRKRSKKLTS